MGGGVLRQNDGWCCGIDPESHDANVADFRHWNDIEVHFRGEIIRFGGYGFCGIGRRRPLNILQQRAETLGIRQHFEFEVDDDSVCQDADLVIASDGVNSKTRARNTEIVRPDIDVRKCRSI